MFVLTTVTRDCKNGDLYVSVDDNTAMRPSFSTTTTGLFSWQSIAMGRFFLLERIGPHGSANFLYSPLNIFAAHLRMGGIFVWPNVQTGRNGACTKDATQKVVAMSASAFLAGTDIAVCCKVGIITVSR